MIGENSYLFWDKSILFLNEMSINHPPNWIVFSTPTLVIIAIPIAYYLFIKNKTILKELVSRDEVEFKFRIDGDWENSEFPGYGENRSYTVEQGENILELWYDDNDGN